MNIQKQSFKCLPNKKVEIICIASLSRQQFKFGLTDQIYLS